MDKTAFFTCACLVAVAIAMVQLAPAPRYEARFIVMPFAAGPGGSFDSSIAVVSSAKPLGDVTLVVCVKQDDVLHCVPIGE
jgi:hypothetical protein